MDLTTLQALADLPETIIGIIDWAVVAPVIASMIVMALTFTTAFNAFGVRGLLAIITATLYLTSVELMREAASPDRGPSSEVFEILVESIRRLTIEQMKSQHMLEEFLSKHTRPRLEGAPAPGQHDV